jgi:AcrR family transcriptional regulator
MARPRFYRLDPERQRAILDSATAEFGVQGYEGASLNRIIEGARLSKGVFYYYFDDKADLAVTVLEKGFRGVLESFERQALPSGRVDFWKFLMEMTRASMESLRAGPGHTEVMTRLGLAATRDPELNARLQPFMRDAARAATRFWRRGQEMGAVRTDLPPMVIVQLLQGVKEALARVALPQGRLPTRREVDRFLDLLMDVYRRIAGPQGTARRASEARV